MDQLQQHINGMEVLGQLKTNEHTRQNVDRRHYHSRNSFWWKWTASKCYTETWDGTNWTEVGDLNTAKTDIGGGVGTSTAALSASGNRNN